MPVVVKALCGATIGFLVGLYLANTFAAGVINWMVYLPTALGAVAGIWWLRR